MNVSFNKGDLIRIVEGVHQDEIPNHRLGVVVGFSAHGDNEYYPDVYDILFLGNTQPMRFHEMYIEHVEKE
tara:strand:- start:447 stop:659 length:213 start_codon:yes stop_codon:yes gene_type:complete